MKYYLTIIIIICLLLSVSIINSCDKTENLNSADGKESSDNIPDEYQGTDYIDDSGKKDEQNEISESSDRDKNNNDIVYEEPCSLENDIMFYNSEANFAFIYPQESIVISSHIKQPGEYPGLFLEVSINPIESLKGSNKEDALSEKASLENGLPGNYPDSSFESSRKLTGVLDTNVKEFLTLAEYDNVCGVTFDREALFYNNDYRVKIKLSANPGQIIENMSQYFSYDNKNCPGQISWNQDSQEDFYQKLINGDTSAPVLEWYETFDSIMYLLQINEFKGASAGYSKLIDKRIFEENMEENYIIDISYPEFQSAVAGEGDESINTIVYEDEILSIINDFKNEISSYKESNFDSNYFLAIDYSVAMYDENAISICFDIYPYLGGAHGMLYYSTINFDPEKIKTVEIGELFKEGYDYYSVISEYCRDSLAMQVSDMGFEPDMNLLKNGTDPGNKENFRNFLATPRGLMVKFLPYQVAPYAVGGLSVTIPYSEFEDNLNPESIIGDYSRYQ